MSCENSDDIDVPLPAERNGNASLPFVEVRNDRGMNLAREILEGGWDKNARMHSGMLVKKYMSGHTSPRNQATT
jgi:hypothetical protein